MKERSNPATAHTQSRQCGAQTTSRSSALVRGRSTQFIANPCRWQQRPCPETRLHFCLRGVHIYIYICIFICIFLYAHITHSRIFILLSTKCSRPGCIVKIGSVLQYVAVCCSLLRCVAVQRNRLKSRVTQLLPSI